MFYLYHANPSANMLYSAGGDLYVRGTSSADLLWQTDGAGSIGATASGRPASIYCSEGAYAKSYFARGDVGAGAANTICFTNATAAPDTGTTTLASPPTGIAVGQQGWIKIYVGTGVAYLPYWDA